MTDFGAGPFLTQELDFEVTTTGDIRSTNGLQELEKDLALQSMIELGEVLGQRATPQTRARLRARVREVIIADPRVEDVVSIDVRFIPRNDSAEIQAAVQTDNGEQELVFEV